MTKYQQSLSGYAVPSHQRIIALDGVRGAAVLMVMSYHFLMPVGSDQPFERFMLNVFQRGWIGVELFFVLSGFLITGILWNARVCKQPYPLRNFYLRRSLRISPLYYGSIILVLLGGFLIPSLHTSGWSRFITQQSYCWFYAVNIGRDYYGDGMFFFEWFDFGHFWTLAVEEHFYLIWPWVVLLTNRRGFRLICTVLLVGSCGTRIWEAAGASGWAFALTASLRQSESIVIGSLLAILMRRDESRRWISRVAFPLFVVSSLSSVALLTAYSSREAGPVVIFGPIVLGLSFAGLLVILLEAAPKSWWRRTFEARWLQFFGKYSYGLYVWHFLFFPVWLSIQVRISEVTGVYRLGVVVSILIASGVSVGLSLLSWRFLELPLLGLKKHFEASATGLNPSQASQPTKMPQRIAEVELVPGL